jgi:hypothetical protein
MGHERGWNDSVGGLIRRRRDHTGKIPVEELTPLLDNQPTGIVLSQITSDLTGRISVDNEQPAVEGLSPRPRSLQLPGIKSPVAAAADNDNVAERYSIGCVVHRRQPESPP